MRTISLYKYLLIAMITTCSYNQGVSAQIIEKTAYTAGSREQAQVQYLIDHSITYAENMLVRQGAYAPYAAALTVMDSVVTVEGYPGKQNQTLLKVVEDLKSALRAGANKGLYKAVVVYFDATVTDPTTKLPTDAIGAYTEQMNTNGSYTFYFPYKKTELKNLTHSRSFGTISDNEIFTKVSK
ncbi:MAG: hypothetical protein JWQ38_1339 [Flavipsychrobacter sp.]|nr:hypothetical protein [Flavipsychrobacter sp.]